MTPSAEAKGPQGSSAAVLGGTERAPTWRGGKTRQEAREKEMPGMQRRCCGLCLAEGLVLGAESCVLPTPAGSGRRQRWLGGHAEAQQQLCPDYFNKPGVDKAWYSPPGWHTLLDACLHPGLANASQEQPWDTGPSLVLPQPLLQGTKHVLIPQARRNQSFGSSSEPLPPLQSHGRDGMIHESGSISSSEVTLEGKGLMNQAAVPTRGGY